MKTDSQSPKLLTLSERAYRTLLILYPADFRDEYGQQMVQVFRDVCRDVYRHGGANELANWWATAVFDLVQAVIAERRKVNLIMSQAKFIQWTGWLFILGGTFFAVSSIGQLQPTSSNVFDGVHQLSLYALVPGMVLIMLGLFGVWLRYKVDMHLFGKISLIAALIGAVIMSFGWLFTLTAGNGYWNVFMIGWLIQLMGQSVFGGFATTTHLLPKWNFALLIGSGFPLTVVVLVLSSQTAASSVNWVAFAILLLIGIGWLMTGWALNSQPSSALRPAINA
jgi:hypothetical protein